MVLLVIAGSFTELIARLLQMGMWGILGWVSKDFNISDWIESSDNTGSSDNIGWKTLELISTVIRGMTFWVDAFEWLALSGITIAIVISVRTLPTSSNVVIPKAWPYLESRLQSLSACAPSQPLPTLLFPRPGPIWNHDCNRYQRAHPPNLFQRCYSQGL